MGTSPKGIKVSLPGLELGGLRSLRVAHPDLPGILRVGSIYQAMMVSLAHLRRGDIVVTPDGRFRRFWGRAVKGLWVTDQSGLNFYRIEPPDQRLERILTRVSPWRNLLWLTGASLGSLRGRADA